MKKDMWRRPLVDQWRRDLRRHQGNLGELGLWVSDVCIAPARATRGILRVATREVARANTKDEVANAGDPPVVDAEKEGGALDKAPGTS